MPNISVSLLIHISLVIIIAILIYTTNHYHSIYQEQVTSNALLSSKNNELLANIASDNKAIDDLHRESLTREAEAKAALDDAEKKFSIFEKSSQAVLLAKPSSKNMCISANTLFNSYISRGAK